MVLRWSSWPGVTKTKTPQRPVPSLLEDQWRLHSPQSGVIPLAEAIDHYFELALYLLVCTGFATLASTGGLDLARSFWWAARWRSAVFCWRSGAISSSPSAGPRRFPSPISFFSPQTTFFFRAVSCPATVHLALFGVVVRMFSLRRERDHVTLAILAFLMVLASAVLTVDSIFLFSFAAFMMMAVVTFVLMEMRRSGHAANIHAHHSNDPQEHRHLAFSLARMAPALMLMILISGAAVFFLMPRMSAGYMGGYSFGNRPLVRLQRSRSVGSDRTDPAVECGRHAHSNRWRPRRPL